jgi:hypothetical protein
MATQVWWDDPAGTTTQRPGPGPEPARPGRRALLLGGGAALLAAAVGVGVHELRGPAADVVDAADAYRRGLTLQGWPVLDVGDTVLVTAAKRQFRLRPGPTAAVLTDFITRFDAGVERVGRGEVDDWSYARRAVRGTRLVWSEHAAGTAVDLNALRHPQGRSGTFTARQRKALDRLLDRYEGVVGWGGRFARPDEMHVEIEVPPGSPVLARVAARVG